jgi:hypothetical protein
MGNVYGIANPLSVPAIVVGGGDVACPAGSPTTVLSSAALSAFAPGDYYPMIWAYLAILFGATPPTAMSVGFQLGAGSTVDFMALPVPLFVANATILFTVPLVGANSGSAWVGAGSIINVTVNPFAQAVTFKYANSRAVIALFRGPDV